MLRLWGLETEGPARNELLRKKLAKWFQVGSSKNLGEGPSGTFRAPAPLSAWVLTPNFW